MNTIFIIDDSQPTLDLLQRIITQEGYAVEVFVSAVSAIKQMAKCKPDLIIMDVEMPGMNGIQAMDVIAERFPDSKIVIMTAFADNTNSRYFLEKGVVDFIAKPFLPVNIINVIKQSLSSEQTNSFSAEYFLDKRLNIVGHSKVIKECMDKCLKVSNANLPVLILGENGTGKEMFADFIHYNSIRKYNNIVKINCSSIPEGLAENELFGHEKGAFTGANERIIGKVEQAHKGTLFLDEIGEMDMAMQKKLLRVLESKSFERLGGNKTLQSDFRLICATNRILEDEVNTKRFREDLYYRINSVTITLPALRDRREDIPELVRHFLHKYNQEYIVMAEIISDEAMDVLQCYDWPGNIRELKSTVYSMVSLCTDEKITVRNIPEHIISAVKRNRDNIDSNDFTMSLDEVEKLHIIKVLEQTGGNKSRAAALLEISEKTLYNKLHRYQLS
ncbi:sigma-54-dependent transcriptional regulator [Sporomusa acidovorans]|uniref:Transcriptional regulatory protein ZraR n=1 Tax=Sporomusa acidovorans (strain ATCC 49682 / DSM 3132 / Mol) TaxID=1123286 RepID=A0ABZ3J9Y5_SPOA4|nr:sigma-54 dependent transcriptional regulator [Sporomusa acidovorans]OZC21696.1 transcriptional regulatory protein ZraR [Sporomusa acidovorans DSM 3132]SDD59843.1 two-component system, NtrC family, response regulator AtoC [Sporomusa acidovorans]